MVALPPVELYQLNGEYYVVDGHHRMALALENEQAEIDAYVMAHEVERSPSRPVVACRVISVSGCSREYEAFPQASAPVLLSGH